MLVSDYSSDTQQVSHVLVLLGVSRSAKLLLC